MPISRCTGNDIEILTAIGDLELFIYKAYVSERDLCLNVKGSVACTDGVRRRRLVIRPIRRLGYAVYGGRSMHELPRFDEVHVASRANARS